MADLILPMLLPPLRRGARSFLRHANLLLALEDRRALRLRPRSAPVDLVVDPSTICQLACPYCSVGNGSIRRRQAFLEPETHGRFIEAVGETLFVLHYFSTGEPLLNPRLIDCIRQTRDLEIFSMLSTNLSMPLTDEQLEGLLDCGLGLISVSLDGVTAGSYGRYRRGGNFPRVTENLRRLVALRRRRESGAIIEWRFLVFEHNRHEVETARKLARDWDVDLIEFFPGSAPAEAASHEVRMAEGLELPVPFEGPRVEIARGRRDGAWHRRFGNPPPAWAPPPDPSSRRRKCDWLWLGAALFPDGSLGPCCVSNDEDDDFGRFEKGADFEALWRSEPFVAARKRFVDGSSSGGVCDRCPNPDAGDWQFRSTLQALIRNAPDWVLRLLGEDLDRYFWPIDRELLAVELESLLRPEFRGGLEASKEDLAGLVALQKRRPAWRGAIEEWIVLLQRPST